MSDNKTDRASLRRQAQRKGSYAALISKRKYILNIKDDKPNKKLRLGNIRNMNLPNVSSQEYEEEEKELVKRDSILSSTGQSSDSFNESQPGISSNCKLVQSNTVKNEHDISSVMTRSATRKYASVGSLHNKVDWEQQLRVEKRWPVDIAYTIQEPLVQNTQLRDLLSMSLNGVMSFCKNVWSVNKEENTAQKDDQYWVVREAHDIFDLDCYPTRETEIINENNDNSLQQQIINIISIKDEDQLEVFYIQQENEEIDTVTSTANETYVVDEDYVDSSSYNQKGTSLMQEVVYQYDPMIAVLNDHNYAQKCDTTPTKKLKVENLKFSNKDEEEFKLENALNDLLLNTALLKCLVCGESPQEMSSFLERAEF